nr:unnamed protein product [Callosobruchus analis]
MPICLLTTAYLTTLRKEMMLRGFQMVPKAFREFSQQCVSKCRLQICQANRQTLDLGRIDPLCIKMCKQSVRMSK